MRLAEHPAAAWLLGLAALIVAALGAKPYAGSWNDASRLATAESLLDRGTLAIDDSVFVHPPKDGPLPYAPDRTDLLAMGTWDKVQVRGRFYSDKPLFASVMIAGVYRPLEWLGAPRPAERPDVFIRLITILTSGFGYAVAVGCLWVIGRRCGLRPGVRLGWLAAFAFCTYAPTYTQSVNSGAVQLGIVAVMAVLLTAEWRSWTPLALGTLAGIGFNFDFGSGPPLVAAAFGITWWKSRRLQPLTLFSIAVLPWLAAGIGINFVVGGVWKPLNMYPEHFLYPGTPFTAENLTGSMHHAPLNLALYAGGMLFGKHGYLNHNLPLLLTVAGFGVLRRGSAELIGMMLWCASAWLMYAFLSNNMGGGCCSVRWFVPFLVPGFWLLAVLLREKPRLATQFTTLSAGGFVLACLMWWKGPWTANMVPYMWYVVGFTMLAWGFAALRTRRPAVEARAEQPMKLAA